MAFSRFSICLAAWAFVVLTVSPVKAGEATVAVASNFLSTFKQLAHDFQKQDGHSIRTVSGSTGKLYAQIIHGAPFDVFLAADGERPRLLAHNQKAVRATQFTYARGKLVLWSADPKLISGEGASVLRRGAFRHLALANPKTAPYGKAAFTALHRLRLWTTVLPTVVQGENINQTFQFVATGNAEMGFVALSQILDPRLKISGSHWRVPEHLYDAIDQDAVLLTHGQSNPAAQAFLLYLKSDSALNIMRSFGYGLRTD